MRNRPVPHPSLFATSLNSSLSFAGTRSRNSSRYLPIDSTSWRHATGSTESSVSSVAPSMFRPLTSRSCRAAGSRSAFPSRRRSAVAAVDDPAQHAQVVAESRPQELAVLVLAEPVDVEDLRQSSRPAFEPQPVRQVVGEVVAAERLHRHRVTAHDADLAGGRGRGLRRHAGADHHAVRPVAGFVHQRRDFARRPPNRIAEIGTPCGCSAMVRVARILLRGDGEA